MALIFDDRSAAETPRTHVLVIGVGGYRHLADGEDERPQVMEHVGLLRQLTSPPLSAVAFAQWTIRAAASWLVPLGTVEFLVSPHPEEPDPSPDGFDAERANIANVRQAYATWRQRCDRHEDNVAVFYFCGHGLEKREQFLLAEDFGDRPNSPWLGSFAFDSTRLAFHSCRAKTQCFFIDACRKITSGMLTRDPTVMPLEDPDLTVAECAFNLTLQASARNETALGPKRGVSYFTQALIRALSGGAASQEDDGWLIRTGNVSARITDILRLVKSSEGFNQRCSGRVTDSTALLRTDLPKVELEMTCQPEAANPLAQLTCSRIDAPDQPDVRHDGAPWTLEVDAGFYRARARFPAGEFPAGEGTIIATPPAMRRILRCGP